MSRSPMLPVALDIVGFGIVLPEHRIGIDTIFEQERDRIELQLAQLTPHFRARLIDGLGITEVGAFAAETTRDAGCQAAQLALDRAGISGSELALVLDFSTYSADAPGIWSLAHEVQGCVAAPDALALGIHGSGCAGLHAAWLVASGLLSSHPEWRSALLVAADRAPARGRSCLPISFMADAATALVVTRAGERPHALGRIRAVELLNNGRFAMALTSGREPPRMVVDAEIFERKILPLHFVMLHRALARTLGQVGAQSTDLGALVYPNTTALDRSGVIRGFGLDESLLVGPGPERLGHAFANDLLINAEPLFALDPGAPRQLTAWLAAGSGFSWGAAIVEFGSIHAAR